MDPGCRPQPAARRWFSSVEVSYLFTSLARWRKENPELNLSELASQMNLSKSAVNHRLRRLVEIAEAGDEVNKTAS